MMFQTKLASWRDAPMKSLRPESIPSTPMKSPHLCRFNPISAQINTSLQPCSINWNQLRYQIKSLYHPTIFHHPISAAMMVSLFNRPFSINPCVPASWAAQRWSLQCWKSSAPLPAGCCSPERCRGRKPAGQWRPVAIGDLGKWGVEPTTYKTTYIYVYTYGL